jgi:PAS domain S-box-containing protein
MQDYSLYFQAEHNKEYKDLFDNAHDLIHFVKPDGTILYVNNAWSKTLEYSKEEIQHQSIYTLVDEKDRERFFQYRRHILQGEEGAEITIALKSKSGKPIFVEGFISAKMEEGSPVYTRGIFRDITQRVQHEQNLKAMHKLGKEREENMQQLIQFAPDAIIVIDAAGKITLWNPKAEAIFGWKAAEVMGTTLSDKIIPHQHRKAHNEGMKRYLATGEARVLNKTIEITAINKKEEEFYISLTISNTTLAGETAFISFIRDISDQKKNELELQRKRKELEKSNEELEQYAWLTSHDLREPLRKILIYSDRVLTMNKKDLTPDVDMYITKVNHSATRMNNLIQSVLEYSIVNTEHNFFEQVDLNAVLSEVTADLELLIKENNAVIETSPLPTITAVPFQMRQLFQNLISNAIKYKKEEADPIVQISMQKRENNELQIFVKDNGIGFDVKDSHKIFMLFQRLASSEKAKGSGVGLALCKKIVEKHGGTITADSTRQVGTTFTITLPVTAGAED